MLLPSSLLQLKTTAGTSFAAEAFFFLRRPLGAQIFNNAREYVSYRPYTFNAFLRVASGRACHDDETHEAVCRKHRDGKIWTGRRRTVRQHGSRCFKVEAERVVEMMEFGFRAKVFLPETGLRR